MKRKALLTALTLTFTGVAFAAPEIDKARIDSMAAMFLKQAEQDPNRRGNIDGEEIRRQATRRLQTLEVLKNEAVKVGLDKDAELQNQLKNIEAEVYASAYTEYLERKTEVSESDVRKFYDQIARTVKIQQIAFNTPEEAKAAQELLLKGLSFDDLIKRYPDQNQHTNNFVHSQELDPAIGKIIAPMTRGEITKEPVRYKDKFYLIKLAAEERSPEIPPFGQIREQLVEETKQQKVREQIAQILKNNGITP
ncbi:peptidyl-prolyl cis-trans isomerase [Neisseria sp. 83E34]|uniref:peptidylprolyl isomerase n=1 Tax=Neisseria sp. 83E34 TaxID=1692264 RepID=UPI0006CE9B87|nr:peptidylprolyl isomerase [Neisseria sp. 83E34]KPN71105.1 peptidylprolyl isomerase [Neisseria sp. 83E34]